MSKFLGRKIIQSGSGDGYTDHGLLTGREDDDHIQYLITTAIRDVGSPTSGITKTDNTPGDIFSLVNSGSGAALFIEQNADVTDADAALTIINTGNLNTGLSVYSDAVAPVAPLVSFSTSSLSFDEPLLSIIHQDPDAVALEVYGDGYFAGSLEGPKSLVFTSLSYNPIGLGNSGLYVEDDLLYFVDSTGFKYTFSNDELVRVSITDTTPNFLSSKLTAGANINLTTLNTGGNEELLISSSSSGLDGYYPFIEVDELEISGIGSGALANINGTDTSGSITRNSFNNFLIGDGLLEIRGSSLRSSIDSDAIPELTYSVIKNATLIDDTLPNTLLSGGTVLFTGQSTIETETYISGNRKSGEIQFTTGVLDLDDALFNDGSGSFDGYLYFVFSGNHTLDTKTIVVRRVTEPPTILSILFDYPDCAYNLQPQTAIRATQSLDVTVTTAIGDGYSLATYVQIDAGDAAQNLVVLTESSPGVWTGTVTASSTQGNGYADLNVTAKDILDNTSNENTSSLGYPLVLFDNNFPTIESFDESTDLVYPNGQRCLQFSQALDAYMTVTDFTEILYYSPNNRFTIDSPTTYSEQKNIIWDQGASGIEENAGCGTATTTNLIIRARKTSNCSQTTRNIQIRLDDTPPRVASVLWRRNNTGSYTLSNPTFCDGVHGVQVVFDDCMIAIPEFSIQDANKGTLSAFSGTTPGTTFTATLTVSGGTDTNGCTKLILDSALNCSKKLPLEADPFDGSIDEYCIDVIPPNIQKVEIDVYLADGYWNDGYGGPNFIDDDIDNTDNTEQACELNFSSKVQSITANDTVTRHGDTINISVEVVDPIEVGDVCRFDASTWGASSTFAVSQLDDFVYQDAFTANLGSTRVDDQGANIGRASIFHGTGGLARVTDLGQCYDEEPNQDYLSANGIDDIATPISFTVDGTADAKFSVSIDSFRAFVIGRKVKISDDNTSAVIRTVTDSVINGSNGVISCDGGTLASYTVAQNAKAVPLGVTNAEVQAWDTNNGLVAYINDGAFTHLTLVDFANPEAFSQHLEDDQLTQNNTGTVGVDLFRANFWGSKISIPNSNGGTEANPTGVANAKYVWRSKRIRLTTNPTGVQGTNLRFMVFGFSAGTSYRNVNISSTSDWDQNSTKFNLNNNDSQIEIRISTDDPYAAIPPYSSADWYLTTDSEVSPQSGFKFGKSKDINLVFNAPSTDIIDKDLYIEITLITNGSGKAPQIDMIGMCYLT